MQRRDEKQGLWARDWRRRRRRLAVLLVVWLGLPAIAALAAWLAPEWLATTVATPLGVAAAGILLAASWLALLAFPCPRCRRPFHWDWAPHPLVRRCVHCGLPKGAHRVEAH